MARVSILILGLNENKFFKTGEEGVIMAVKVDNGKCTGCAACVDVCPVNAIKIENGKAVVGEECVDCGTCISQCPVEAITL